MDYKVLWGDIHNHNTVGLFHYTKGTLERAIDMAQSHLGLLCVYRPRAVARHTGYAQ